MLEELKKEWEIEFEIEFDKIFHGCGVGLGSVQVGLKSFISSLLAKQQANFVKCLPEEKNKVIHPDDINLNEFYENRGYNACIADIKSKLNTPKSSI